MAKKPMSKKMQPRSMGGILGKGSEKVNPVYKMMGQSKTSGVVKGHQKDLARVAGQVAGRKAVKPGPNAPKPFERGVISRRAEKQTLKSFK